MKRTTIMADDDVLRQLQHLAEQRGTSFAAIVQEAMRSYLAAQQSSTVAALAGIATGPATVDYGDGRDETVLSTEIHPLYGLARDPDRG